MVNDNKLSQEDQSDLYVIWHKFTGEQKILMFVMIAFIIYVTIDGRMVSNITITEACNQDRTVCQNITIIKYHETPEQVPNSDFSPIKAGGLALLVILLIRSFFVQKHFGDIDFDQALLIARGQCDRLNVLKQFHGELRVTHKGLCQWKHYQEGSKRFKWVMGANLWEPGKIVPSHYYVILINHETGNVEAVKQNMYEGYETEFDGTEKTYWDEKPVISPVIKEAVAGAQMAGMGTPVVRQRK